MSKRRAAPGSCSYSLPPWALAQPRSRWYQRLLAGTSRKRGYAREDIERLLERMIGRMIDDDAVHRGRERRPWIRPHAAGSMGREQRVAGIATVSQLNLNSG